MFRMNKKDLALVAVAGGMLAFELVGLHAAAPTVLRTLAGVTGMRGVQAATRGAKAATRTMLDGVGVAAAQAASLAMDGGFDGAVGGAVRGAVKGAAQRAAAVAPIAVRRTGASSHGCPGFSYVMVVRDAKGATTRRLRLVSWQTEVCRAQVRAILAQHRAERAAVRQAAATRRAIEISSEASAL